MGIMINTVGFNLLMYYWCYLFFKLLLREGPEIAELYRKGLLFRGSWIYPISDEDLWKCDFYQKAKAREAARIDKLFEETPKSKTKSPRSPRKSPRSSKSPRGKT